jgi:hypothetical protein
MNFYGLSDQTLIEISKVSPLTWFRICEMVPFIGEWTPCPSTQRLVRKPFIQVVKNCYENINRWLNAYLHHYDLPAIELIDGSKFWYVSGKLHRDRDLPAIEWSNGNKGWCSSGKLHRENDLPAIEKANGRKEWYINGQWYQPAI